MNSILVTGATGFVGRQVLTLLANKPIVLHATFFEKKPLFCHQNIIWHHINLLSDESVTALLTKIKATHCLHLAWYAKPGVYWTSPLNIAWLQSSLHLLHTFTENGGQRAVFVGSCAEYDWSTFNLLHEHFSLCKPATLYGAAKHALHILAEKVAEQKQLSFAWGRLFFTFGEYEYPQRLISLAITALLKKQRFEVKNSNQICDFLYSVDVADALFQLLVSNVVGAVNVASGKPITVGALIDIIANKLSATALVDYRQVKLPYDNRPVVANITRLTNEVGWSPQFSLDKALDRTIAWWKQEL